MPGGPGKLGSPGPGGWPGGRVQLAPPGWGPQPAPPPPLPGDCSLGVNTQGTARWPSRDPDRIGPGWGPGGVHGEGIVAPLVRGVRGGLTRVWGLGHHGTPGPPAPAGSQGRGPEGGWTPAGVARFPRGLARGDTGWHAFQLGANSPPRGHPPGPDPSLGPLELAASRNGPGAGREGGYFPWSHTYRGPTGLQPPVPHTPCMPPVPSASPPRALPAPLAPWLPLARGIRGFQRGWPGRGHRDHGGQGVPGAGGPLFRANTGRNRGGSRLPRARPPSPRTGTRGNSPVLPPRGGQPAPGPSPASPGGVGIYR